MVSATASDILPEPATTWLPRLIVIAYAAAAASMLIAATLISTSAAASQSSLGGLFLPLPVAFSHCRTVFWQPVGHKRRQTDVPGRQPTETARRSRLILKL
jgi:hypothetical protein